MLDKQKIIGLISGVLIVIFAVIVFASGVNVYAPSVDKTDLYSAFEPEFEEDEYYGGDAYTGIQQAAAQSANNAISVYDAVVAGNVAAATQAENQARNIRTAVETIKTCFGFLLLSIGLLTIVKHVDVVFVIIDKKKAASAVNAQPEFPQYDVNVNPEADMYMNAAPAEDVNPPEEASEVE